MMCSKSTHLIALAFLALAASGGTASAAGHFVQIAPGLVPNNNFAGQVQTAPSVQVHACHTGRWYGKAELYEDMVGVPVTTPDWVKNKLLPVALHNWQDAINRDLGSAWMNPGIALRVESQVQYDGVRHVWWANWSAIPCRQ